MSSVCEEHKIPFCKILYLKLISKQADAAVTQQNNNAKQKLVSEAMMQTNHCTVKMLDKQHLQCLITSHSYYEGQHNQIVCAVFDRFFIIVQAKEGNI